MEKSEMLKSLQSAKTKLMAAISMLLVSAILFTNVSYAWFVLSTAPEVSGMSTTSGANGALEIALQSTNSDNSRAVITNDVGDSSSLTGTTAASANVTWGNIVDISTGYGLENITLYPARLNVDKSTNKILTSNYLAVPQYGTDGRVSNLENMDMLYYVETDGSGSFANDVNYGVNVHGKPSTVGESETVVSYFSRETVRKEAVATVSEYRETLRTDMRDLVERNSLGLVSIIFKSALESWGDTEIDAVEDLILGAEQICNESVDALRWALLARVVADTDNYSPDDDNEMKALGKIYQTFRTLPLSSTDDTVMTVRSIAQGTDASNCLYPELVSAVDTLVSVQNAVQESKDLFYIDGDPKLAGACLVTLNTTYFMCGTETGVTPQNAVEKEIEIALNNGLIDGLYVIDDVIYFVMPTEISDMNKPGLFPTMALILGDYNAEILAYMDSDETTLTTTRGTASLFKMNYHMRATSADTINGYNVENNTGALYSAYSVANVVKASGNIPLYTTRSDVTAYGYSVDLAFRTSEDGKLILQQEAVQRVNDGTTTQATQGSGTTMDFEIFGDMTGDQAEELVENIYIVFMNRDDGTIYAVGRAEDATAELEKVSATIRLYDVDTEAMAEAGDGVLRLGDARSDNTITSLKKDEVYYITALVYLNGDTVTSGNVAPQGLSLVGSINMQFSTDALLTAMRQDAYYTAPTEAEE